MNNFNFKKKFGQNFLVDKNIVKKIVSGFDVLPNSLVIEIGCGSGLLTKDLCLCFDNVLGYEIDIEVKDQLMNNLSAFSNYEIIFDDFLKRDILKDLKKYSYDNLYIIANLPYYITTPIIEKITNLDLDVEMMRFMVQKEVGDRFAAKVGTKEYNSLSIYLNYNYIVKKNFIVSKHSFYPVPNVDSLVISFYKNTNKFYVKNVEYFYKLVRDSFKYKRKTLRNNLKDYDLEKINEVLLIHGLDLSVRAENIDIEIFCEISNKLCI